MFAPPSQAVNDECTPLAYDFQPGEHDVICSRGKGAYTHIGNRNFRNLIDQHAERYAATQSRAEKSVLIMAVEDIVQRRSPNGGFVKFCKRTNAYVRIGNCRAREKIGHAFREAIDGSGLSSWTSNAEEPSKKKASTTTDNVELCEEDLPLPLAAAQQMPLLEAFAASCHSRDKSASSMISAFDMNSDEFRKLAE